MKSMGQAKPRPLAATLSLEGKGFSSRAASKSAANRRTKDHRREEDVVREKEMLLEHCQQVHRSAKALRARRTLFCRRSFKSDPDEHDGGENNSGARR